MLPVTQLIIACFYRLEHVSGISWFRSHLSHRFLTCCLFSIAFARSTHWEETFSFLFFSNLFIFMNCYPDAIAVTVSHLHTDVVTEQMSSAQGNTTTVSCSHPLIHPHTHSPSKCPALQIPLFTARKKNHPPPHPKSCIANGYIEAYTKKFCICHYYYHFVVRMKNKCDISRTLTKKKTKY